MSLLHAPEPVLPVLPTHAPIEFQHNGGWWFYAVARWPGSRFPQRFVWHLGELYWTEVTLH